MLTKLLTILNIMLLLSCGQKLQGKNSISRKEDQYLKRIKIGNTEASARIQPEDYKEVFGKNNVKESNSSNDQFVYFNVRFNRTNESGFTKEKILYLNFDMQNDFVLLKKRDSIAPAFCQRIENGMKNNFEYIVAFEKKDSEIEKEISLIYKDKIFSIGTVAFVYQ